MLERYGPVPHVIEGALGALIQGAPLPVDRADLAVARADLAVFETWLRRMGALAWNEERQQYEDRHVDLRLYDTMRWQTAFGPILVRFCDRPPRSVEVRHDETFYRVRPLADVEVADHHTAALLHRYRELAESSPAGGRDGIMAPGQGYGG
jgi:hypothetical protein